MVYLQLLWWYTFQLLYWVFLDDFVMISVRIAKKVAKIEQI